MLVAMLSILLTREADVPPMPHGEKAKAVVAADSSVDWVAPVAPQTESDAVPPAASLQAKRPALSELTAKAEREEKSPEKRKAHADFAEAPARQSPVSAPAAEALKLQDAAEISLPHGPQPLHRRHRQTHVGAGRGSYIATVLEKLGYKNVKVYTGSWDEWGDRKSVV